MLYTLYELGRASLAPWRFVARTTQRTLRSPLNPASYTPQGRSLAAAADVFESVTRRYLKPEWGLPETEVNGASVPVIPHAAVSRRWCDLVHFQRDPAALSAAHKGKDVFDPKVMIVAPMSGHYATLLRGTVEAFLPDHEVYVTDWTDASAVPITDGRFDLDDYVDQIREFLQVLGPQTHVVAVCQPGPAVLAAAALMNEDGDPSAPASLTIMGSPIDARRSPTEPNRLAEARPISWFEANMIHTVPAPHPGVLRRVYPGFIQLASFMNMNWDRHVDAHWSFFEHLVEQDGDSAEKHREFYDEYLSVMDLTEEFYIQTIDRVFQRHLLATGAYRHRDRLVRPEKITATALLTVEGENDDISGIGQTQAAHDLCTALSPEMKLDHVQPKVGHYGVFNGSRFRKEIQPIVAGFIRKHWDEKTDRNTRVDPTAGPIAAE
ncbi:MAG: polyhydroxyalkanoate depolymerase [Maricaulaceae bacterium]